MTFDAAIGAVRSMMPLSSFAVAARLCFFTMFTPSTSTRNCLGKTRRTLPSFPRCSPEITRTVSPLAMCILWRSGSRASDRRRPFLKTSGFMSDHLRRQRYDFHELLFAQLASHRSEDAGRTGFALIGDEHRGVLVEPDIGAIPALGLLGRPDDHRLRHLALLDLAGGDGVLDRDDHDVTQPRVAALGSAEHPDHERPPRARVVRDLENRFLLYHGPLPRPLLRALDDFDDPPPLGLGQRAGLDDPHRVTRLGALAVVARHLLGAYDLLAVEPVREPTHERHRDGLLHLVAHHYAGANLAPPPHVRALSLRVVLGRAISRRVLRSSIGFVSASVARRNPRRNRSSVSTTSCCSKSSLFISRSASGFFVGILAFLPPHELRLDRQLGRRELQGLPRQILRDALELEHHAPRFHDRYPALGIPFALPHAGLRRLLGDRLVGK